MKKHEVLTVSRQDGSTYSYPETVAALRDSLNTALDTFHSRIIAVSEPCFHSSDQLNALCVTLAVTVTYDDDHRLMLVDKKYLGQVVSKLEHAVVNARTAEVKSAMREALGWVRGIGGEEL